MYAPFTNNFIDYTDINGNGVVIEHLVVGRYGYFHVYYESDFFGFQANQYLGSTRYRIEDNINADQDEGIAILYARKIRIDVTLEDIASSARAGIIGCEVAIRIAVEPLDLILNIGEFIEEPSWSTAAGFLPFIPGGVGKILKMRHPRFGNFYRDPQTKYWWSIDRAGHGGSAYKVFKEKNNKLIWIYDADEMGKIINGKHKGPTGEYIPLKDFIKNEKQSESVS